MNKECQGCYLFRNLLYESIFEPPKPDQITCENENLDCPCKTCLVKITCNIIEGGACEKFIEFNVKYRKETKCQ